MSALLFLCSAGLLASCEVPSPTAIDTEVSRQAASVPATAHDGCAEVEVTLSGRDRVSVRFPAPAACTGGLVLVPGGEARYDRPRGGRLELPVAVRNATDADVTLPARVLLAADSVQVLFPAGLRGQLHKRPPALDADGVVPEGESWAGAWHWDVGGPGTLGAGAQSPSRTLAFTVPDGVQRFRLAFGVEAQTAALDTIWPVVTGSGPMLDTTVVVSLTADPDGEAYFRTAITITFEAGVSNATKAAFFARHSITVLGIDPATNPIYYVQIPDPGKDIQAFRRALSALRAEPETRFVLPIVHRGMRLIGLARFPDDGGGMIRADWMEGGSSTWAMQAVRAPLAWGCETGDYGGQPVRVGVFEWKHQPAHPEFAHSSPAHREPTDDSTRIATSRPLHTDSVAARERHAAGVTGLLSAQGDNASGIAGMMWRSGLYLYSGLSAQDRPGQLLRNVRWLSEQTVADGIRVLNLSSVSGFSIDARAADVTEYSLEVMRLLQTELLDRLPNLLVVVAAGNDALRGSVDGYIRPGSGAELGALLRLRQNPAYRDRIIVVTGTGPGGSHSEFSNSFPDATDIAAPAVAVSSLDRWSGQTGSSVPVRFPNGTSYAAPLVAGTAGLLLSMDPTLTAAEVKDYIVRGAAWPRYRSETGRVEAPPEVSGLAGVRQLDAYGALTLLSHERRGTPICGVRVEVAEGGLVLDRTEVSGGERLQLAGVDTVGFPSVAQGGRRIAVTDIPAQRVMVFDHTGGPLHEIADVQERQYLERDTADIRWVPHDHWPFPIYRKVVRIRGPRRSEVSLDPAALVTSWPTRVTPTMRLSMDGQRLVFEVVALDWDGTGDEAPSRVAFTYGVYLVRSNGGELTTVERTDCVVVQSQDGGSGCEEADRILGVTASWDHDARHVTLAFPEYLGDDDVRTRLRRLTATGGAVSSSVIQNREVYNLQTTADDQLLAGLELNWSGECYLAWRAAAPLGNSVEQRRVGDASTPVCRNLWFARTTTQSINNAHIADVTVALGAPAAGVPATLRHRLMPLFRGTH